MSPRTQPGDEVLRAALQLSASDQRMHEDAEALLREISELLR